MEQDEHGLAEVERRLEGVLRSLTYQGRYDSDSWLLMAGIVEEADRSIRRAREKDPSIEVPLFEAVMEAFRAETDNFRNVEFQRAARVVRRRCPHLFQIS